MLPRSRNRNSTVRTALISGGATVAFTLVIVWSSAIGAGEYRCVSVPALLQDDEENMVRDIGVETETDDSPLVDQKPFDIVILDRNNEFARIKVVQLKETAELLNQAFSFLNLRIPRKPFDYGARSTLKFQLIEFPEKYWQVPWSSIEEVLLFEDLLLEEAEEFLKADQFDLCFRTLLYLMDNLEKRNSIEVRQMYDRCLAEDGRQSLADGRYDDALATYEELHRRNPRFRTGGKSALDVVAECYERLVQSELDTGDFLKALKVVAIMDKKFGDRIRDTIDRLTENIDSAAITQLGRVRKIVGEGESEAAHEAVRRLVYVMPGLTEGHEMFRNVVQQFPHVYVGVTQTASTVHPSLIHDWAAKRVGRLTHRWLFEFDGLTDDGGRYTFPNGTFTRVDDQGKKYRLEVDVDQQAFGVPAISTFEVSNRLLAMADDTHPDYFIPWARVLESVEMDGDNAVIINLNSSYVRPEALLQTSYMRSDSKDYDTPNGKYKPVETRDRDTVYKLNDLYDPLPDHQHPTIIERVYPSASLADEALIKGEIDVVDRIYPADWDRLRRHPDIEVKPYGVPTVHVLIPNHRNLHMKSVGFRRSLVYAISRESLVKQYISNGRSIDGYGPVSGPFPPGSDKTEEISYAYNPTIQPRSTSGELALVLASTVEETERARIRAERDKKKRDEMAGLIEPEAGPEDQPSQETPNDSEDGSGDASDGAGKNGVGKNEAEPQEEKIIVERPTFILVHPDNELVENLCKSMVQQWNLVDVKVELRKLPPGQTVPKDDDYDLLYMEIFMQEPLVDAFQLFGQNGFVKNVDATIRQALWQLDEARSWSEVAGSLRRIHQQSFSNMTVIPLWQIIDHYAYRTHVNNIGNQIVHLYQNVERWKIAPQIPVAEEKE